MVIGWSPNSAVYCNDLRPTSSHARHPGPVVVVMSLSRLAFYRDVNAEALNGPLHIKSGCCFPSKVAGSMPTLLLGHPLSLNLSSAFGY